MKSVSQDAIQQSSDTATSGDSTYRSLAPFAEDYEQAAREATDQAQIDALEILAALARRDPLPPRAAERVAQRAQGDR